MIWVAVIAGLVLFVYGYHRLARWAAARGWIYYGKTHKRRPAPWLGLLDAIYKPEIEYVVEEQSAQEIRADQDESGRGRWGDGAPG